MPIPAETTGLILAGGESQRFGRDKALAVLDERTFIERVHAALEPHTCEVLVSTGERAREYPVQARVVLDSVTDGGPLAGLAAGLGAASTPWLLALAVDLPYVTPSALALLLTDACPEADGVVALDAEGRRQPVCALWRVEAVAPVVREQVESGDLALWRLVERLRVREVSLGGAVRNVNVPRDL